MTIPFKYSFDINIGFINVRFYNSLGFSKTIVLSPETRVDQMLKIYFSKIGENELMNKQKFKFRYNALSLGFGDYEAIGQLFKGNQNPKVNVEILNLFLEK